MVVGLRIAGGPLDGQYTFDEPRARAVAVADEEARMITAASACPVCGQRLASSDQICNECGAVLALRLTRARRPTTVKSRFAAGVHRQFAEISRLGRDRGGYYIVAALLVTLLTAAAIAGVFARRGAVEIAPRAERSETKRSTVLDDQRQLERRVATTRAAGASPQATRSPRDGWTTAGMVAAAVVGAVLWAVAVTSARRRRHDRTDDTPAWIASGHMTHAAYVGAAFCCGLAVALAVVLAMESPVAQPPAAFATVEGERVDQWRLERSTLSERLSVLDARLASLESTRAGERAARQQPTSPRLELDSSRTTESGRAARAVGAADEPARSAAASPAVPANEAASTTITAADVLRSPRVATATLADRVWDDIARDWERLRRSVRELLPRDTR